jgi:hypothetical protein
VKGRPAAAARWTGAHGGAAYQIRKAEPFGSNFSHREKVQKAFANEKGQKTIRDAAGTEYDVLQNARAGPVGFTFRDLTRDRLTLPVTVTASF